MTRFIQSTLDIIDAFDVAVLDQWGVLHNGSVPYPHAAEAIRVLHERGKQVVVLSNSGKRAEINRQRIADMRLPTELIAAVVTSGEALRDDLLTGRLLIDGKTPRVIFPICGKPGDAEDWRGDASELVIAEACDDRVDGIMLMGLADGCSADAYDATFQEALALGLPLICSNPDKTSPRAGGLVVSPGALADRYAQMGGRVVWYGKPYRPVYEAVLRRFPNVAPARMMMVGDSLEHDIAGAQAAGLLTAWVRGGIHAEAFDGSEDADALASATARLAERYDAPLPDYSLSFFA